LSKSIYGEENRSVIDEIRLLYMSAIISAATHLKISPISEMRIPKRSDMKEYDFQDFRATLQFYLVQLMLKGSERRSRASIVLKGDTKTRLRTLTGVLRTEIRNLDLKPNRIEKLVRHIEEFEHEIENPRLTLASVAGLALTIAAGISAVGGTANVVKSLVHQVEELVGLAKEAQEEEVAERLVTTEQILQLEAPRRAEPPPPASNDLDDEIPF
jgi:hypothetical protein